MTIVRTGNSAQRCSVFWCLWRAQQTVTSFNERQDDEIKRDEIGKACSMHRSNHKYVQNYQKKKITKDDDLLGTLDKYIGR
jgi:hypothetical protein